MLAYPQIAKYINDLPSKIIRTIGFCKLRIIVLLGYLFFVFSIMQNYVVHEILNQNHMS